MTKQQYIQEMHNRDRVVIFVDDSNNIKAMLTFFITDDISKFNRSNELWNIPSEEDRDGKYVLIDRLITDHKQSLRYNFANTIKYFNSRFPNKKVVWKSRSRYGKKIRSKDSK